MGVAAVVVARLFCGNFPAAEIKPAICDRLFPLIAGNFFGFRRALLEITKRRRIGDDFTLALRLTSRRRWRLALFGVVFFRFNINETAITRFGLEKFTGLFSQYSRRLCTAFIAHRTSGDCQYRKTDARLL